MNHEDLISQVKDEYSRLADMATKDSFVDKSSKEGSNETYYEDLLQDVIYGIQAGNFDGFSSGKDIVEAVANNKSEWI